jgi:hypothetical protein
VIYSGIIIFTKKKTHRNDLSSDSMVWMQVSGARKNMEE